MTQDRQRMVTEEDHQAIEAQLDKLADAHSFDELRAIYERPDLPPNLRSAISWGIWRHAERGDADALRWILDRAHEWEAHRH